MGAKSVQLSARISNEDAEFLSQLNINGAKTPSDKLRAIITQARKRSVGIQDYSGCYKMIQDLSLPISEAIRKHEFDHHIHSELIIRFFEWLPDMVAFAISSVPEENRENIKSELELYEKGLANRMFGLFESLMQMGVGTKNPCYDPEILFEKIEPVLALAKIITTINKQGDLR